MALEKWAVCDKCGKKEKMPVLTWIETKVYGIDARHCNNVPIDTIFCSWNCVRDYAYEAILRES
jgi:hypothetical protein